jgi:hypothetical protein
MPESLGDLLVAELVDDVCGDRVALGGRQPLQPHPRGDRLAQRV